MCIAVEKASTQPHISVRNGWTLSLVMDCYGSLPAYTVSYSLYLPYNLGTSALSHLELLLCAVDVYSETEIPIWPNLSYLQPTASQVGESCKKACMQRKMVSNRVAAALNLYDNVVKCCCLLTVHMHIHVRTSMHMYTSPLPYTCTYTHL